MVKTRELTNFEHRKVVGFYEASDSKRAISSKTGYGKTTIHNIIAKYRKTGAITVASRSGHPKKLTDWDKRHLKVIINKNWRKPVEKIRKVFAKSTGNDLSRRTIQQTLYEMGYNSRTALKKPCISQQN
ncbi:hypothetical protein RclHR1_00510016 [Rhizophagus clarus]|uniref:Aminoacyl tRNA synthase complex-interacting multifunctional protein 1-like n=1 Tax=Rhizophagus clarus TaxID=94130 RepID=A0A2Z6RY81_9GLOM|nr:hypothetical protein RclHR1_00510016 [Rhizophagus clarus]GES89505.1 aminoacyl tRNA synthase complex-interacting multifunctional protein 1-like [Rhizophagus clarus]